MFTLNAIDNRDIERIFKKNGSVCSCQLNQKRNLLYFQEMDEFKKTDSYSGFDGEFQSLKVLEDVHVFTTNEGVKMENINKNRYRNVLPCK